MTHVDQRRDRLALGDAEDACAHEDERITTVVLAIVNPPEERARMPRVEETLPLAEVVHQALIWRAAKGERIDCPELTGHERNGQPLERPHVHAYILPLDLDRDRQIDHVVLHAQMGFSSLAMSAIHSLHWLHSPRPEEQPWTSAIHGYRKSPQFDGLRLRVLECQRGMPHGASSSPRGAMLGSLFAGQRGALIWESLTPFVPPRYLKKSGKHDLFGQVNAELAARHLPPAAKVETLPSVTIGMQAFARVRQHGGSPPPQHVCHALRVTLVEPTDGPLAIGYASHFGLGLFAATQSSTGQST